MSNTRQQLEKWLNDIKVSGKILDIGGSQNIINKRIKYSEAEFTILDLKEPHECKEKPDFKWDLNKTIYWGQDDHPLYNEFEKYDYAFCMEVSEYWYNPFEALQNIKGFLKYAGTLFISFHFQYPVHNPVKEDCLRYTPEGAKKLLEETGFKIKNVIPRFIEEPESNKALWKFWGNEKMRPAKGYDEHHLTGVLIEAQKY